MNTKNGIEIISDERTRQVALERFNPLHDAQHHRGELATAAACYAGIAGAQAKFKSVGISGVKPPNHWPFERESWKPADDPVRTLAKAGALIAAEIDRIQLLRAQTDAIELKPGRGLADS